jgi:hypothetical protein
VQLAAQRTVAVPVERRVDDDRLGHERGAVRLLALKIVAAERVWEERGVPVDAAADRAGVRIEQQLRRVATVTVGRIPRPMHAETVALTRSDARQIAVEAERGAFGQRDRPLVVMLVEQTEIDPLRNL